MTYVIVPTIYYVKIFTEYDLEVIEMLYRREFQQGPTNFLYRLGGKLIRRLATDKSTRTSEMHRLASRCIFVFEPDR